MQSDPPTLASVITALRKKNNWTQKEMSERSGIPLSTLAKVEHGRLSLTYDKLQEVCRRLQIRMSDLLAEPEENTKQSVTARRSIARLETAMRVTTQQYDYNYLCADLRHKGMIPILGVLRARSLEEFGELLRHPGEEFIFVLDGEIELHTEFYQPMILKPGEGAYLDSNMGHAYLVAPGFDEARILGICASADGEPGFTPDVQRAMGSGSARTKIPGASAPAKSKPRERRASKSSKRTTRR